MGWPPWNEPAPGRSQGARLSGRGDRGGTCPCPLRFGIRQYGRFPIDQYVEQKGRQGCADDGNQHQGRIGRRIELGRPSCRERVCQFVLVSVVDVSIKKKNIKKE